MTFAPPFQCAININHKIRDTSREHHRRFGATTANQDNSPNREVESIIYHPNPPRFGIAQTHKNNAAKIDAVRGGVKPAQTLARNEAK